MALGVVVTAQIMILLDATVVNVAVPSAQADLGFSGANRQWVITAYVLVFGSLLPLGGRLADAYGRKAMFIVGLLGFAIASAVGGAAPNIGTLVTARAVQGGFAAILAQAALSLITVIFTDLRELNKAFGIFGAVSGSAVAIGLLLGGLLADYVSWRWCMYVNIVLAVVGLIGGLTLLHNSTEPDKPKRDAVQAIGGRRLTPLQSVAALSEAIDVIRGVWDADGPGRLDVDGEFYSVHGAERGPAPAHEIPIWLGAHKPKMQGLVGRKADGWLPSLPVMEPGGLQKGNAIIDDAARAANRDPREITRLLNIFPSQQTAEALAQMAVEDGVSVFILASDGPDVLERFAAETIPAVREHVARERS
jgi:hypothetical protein